MIGWRNMRRHVPPLIAALTSILGSVAMFAILVAVLRPGHISREYLGIAVWSVPLAMAVGLIAAVLRRRLSGRSVLTRCIGAIISGVLTGVAWAFASYYLSGGYVLAFDAPVLYCWSVGAILGLFVAFFWADMRHPSVRAAT
jgi:hypothetical protein